MKKSAKQSALAELEKLYKGAKPALKFRTPYELLVAVILSAQCTDARVNMVTPALFARFPTLDAFCEAVKTRRYTMSRVKRMACCAALGLFGVPELPAPYLRVLAIGPKGKQLLGEMKKRCSVPFSESLLKLSDTDARCAAFAKEECRATDLYNFVRKQPLAVGEDFTRRLYVSHCDEVSV